MGCHLAPDETVVTLIKTGSSGVFSLVALFSTPKGMPVANNVTPPGNYSCILFSA